MKNKPFQIALRLDDKTKSALDFLASEWRTSLSETIRRSLIAAAASELKREHDEASE